MIRVRLLKSWKSANNKTYPVGTILQLLNSLSMELIADKVAEVYNGEYPPREKQKIKLSQLKTK